MKDKKFILEFSEKQKFFYHNYNTKDQYTNGFITIMNECTDEDFKALKIKLKNVNSLTNEQVLKTAYNYKISI